MRHRLDTRPVWAIALLLCCWMLVPAHSGIAAGSETDRFSRTFQWYFRGKTIEMNYEFSWEDYHFYQERPRAYANYAVYSYEHPSHPVLDSFIGSLMDLADSLSLNEWERLHLVVTFVQSLQYVREEGEYPKYPIETLAEKGGDCEDTSILLVSILARMGYDAVLVNPPGHMAVAIACRNCQGPAYQRNDRRYYYIETTGTGFAIGDIPKEYQSTKDKLIALRVSPKELWTLYTPKGQERPSPLSSQKVPSGNRPVQNSKGKAAPRDQSGGYETIRVTRSQANR